MHVQYRGITRGLAMLARQLEAEGLIIRYEASMEERSGATDVAHNVTVWILQQGAAGLVGGAASVGAAKSIAAIKARFPRAEIEIKDPPSDERQLTRSDGDAMLSAPVPPTTRV